jgi:hypothetical protein
MIRDWVPLLVEEVITDNCGEVVDDDDALACVAEETIEAIDDVTLVVFFVDSSAPLSTILKNISNSLSSFLLLVSSKLLRTSSSFSKTAAFMTS